MAPSCSRKTGRGIQSILTPPPSPSAPYIGVNSHRQTTLARQNNAALMTTPYTLLGGIEQPRYHAHCRCGCIGVHGLPVMLLPSADRHDSCVWELLVHYSCASQALLAQHVSGFAHGHRLSLYYVTGKLNSLYSLAYNLMHMPFLPAILYLSQHAGSISGQRKRPRNEEKRRSRRGMAHSLPTPYLPLRSAIITQHLSPPLIASLAASGAGHGRTADIKAAGLAGIGP